MEKHNLKQQIKIFILRILFDLFLSWTKELKFTFNNYISLRSNIFDDMFSIVAKSIENINVLKYLQNPH